MMELKPHFSDIFEIAVFKRDALGNIKEGEPKEHYSTNDAEKLYEWWERKVGYLERKKDLAERKKRQREEKPHKILTRSDIEKKSNDSTGRSILAQQKQENL